MARRAEGLGKGAGDVGDVVDGESGTRRSWKSQFWQVKESGGFRERVREGGREREREGWREGERQRK